ncbi:MAG: HEAT repeat domain-containing protein [Chloroflexota bacterium]
MEKLAIDFGTTNSVIARWDREHNACQVMEIPEMSVASQAGGQPVIPSLLYVEDGQRAQVHVGQGVRTQGLDRQRCNRLFRNFKRGILDEESQPRYIDGHPWSDKDAGRMFVQAVLQALPYSREQIEQLVLTVPVMAFDGYVSWLNATIQGHAPERVRIVDESTAAALGYAVTEPGAPVMVFDFGGGSLDLSLVELPQGRAQTGGFLNNLLGQSAKRQAARVVAKSGLLLGGSDVDRWLLEYVLQHMGIPAEALKDDLAPLLSACEQAKITLSNCPQAEISFEWRDSHQTLAITQAAFEAVLEAHGFFELLRQAVDKLMLAAHRRGIYREDIKYVLLIGGTSLMPAVQRTLRQYFEANAVRVEKPFTAVAEGALQLALGYGLEDYLAHGYGLRCLDIRSGRPYYEEILPMGSRYPTEKPVRLRLGAAHPNQEVIEFVIGEIDADAVAAIDVQGHGDQAVFLADGRSQKIEALNPGEQAITVRLDPPGRPGKDRLQVDFDLDDQLQLSLTVFDLQTRKELLHHVALTSLRPRPSSRKAEHGVYLVAPEDNFQYDTSQPDWEEKFRQDGVRFTEQNLANLADAAMGVAKMAEVANGREPRLSAGLGGRFHVSLRGLANVLGSLQPNAVPLEVAAEALHSPDFLTRYSAAEMLSRRNDAGARRLLEETLKTGTPPQRASVARHLFRLPWEVTEAFIEHALHDTDRRVRSAAVSALCHLQTANAYRLLAEALPHEDDVVRLAAAWGLGQNPQPAAVPILAIVLQSRDPEVQVKALEVLGEMHAVEGIAHEGIALTREAINTTHLDVKYAATLSLIELAGEAAFPDVMALVRQTHGLARQAILRAFFHATNYLFIDLAQYAMAVELIASLQLALSDELPETRLAAAMPLIWMRHPQAEAIVQWAYQNETDPEIKSQILAATVNLLSPGAAAMLSAAEQDRNPDLRALADYLRRTRRI